MGIHRSTPSFEGMVRTRIQIATALVERLINGPPIKNEDCNALQKLSISVTNRKNILQDVGYLNKVDKPDSLQKIVAASYVIDIDI